MSQSRLTHTEDDSDTLEIIIDPGSEKDVTTPFFNLTPEPQPLPFIESRFQRLVVKPLITGINTLKNHPFSSMLALLTALPGGINSFCMVTNLDPKDLIEGLKTMSSTHLLLASINAFSAISINTALNLWFFSDAFIDLKLSLTQCSGSIGGFLTNNLSLIIGMSAFLSAGALSYAAFLWLPQGEIAAIIPALFNGLVNFATRYTGLQKIFKRIHDYLDKDLALEKDAIYVLNHLKAECIEEANIFLQDKALTDATILELFTQIDALNQRHPVMHAKKVSEYVKEYIGLIFDITLASATAFYVFPTFTQSGYEGTEIIAHLLKQDDAMTTLPRHYKQLIGALPGLASSLFFWIHLFDFRTIAYQGMQYLKNHPEELPHAALLSILNLFSGSGMHNISTNVVNNPANLFSFTPNGAFSQSYVWANACTGTSSNAKVIFDQLYLHPASLNALTNTSTVQTITSALTTNTLSPETKAGLKQLSLFNHQQNPAQKRDQAEDSLAQVMIYK